MDHDDWREAAKAILRAWKRRWCGRIQDLEILCNIEDAACQEFALQHGFQPANEEALLHLDRQMLTALPPSPPIEIQELSTATIVYGPAIKALHDRLFPQAYHTGQEMVNHAYKGNYLGMPCHLWMASNKSELLGYSYAEVEPEFHTGRIEFVGVQESIRGKGWGKALTIAAINWLFSFDAVREITLTCNTKNTSALALYAKLGFEIVRIVRFYKKEQDA